MAARLSEWQAEDLARKREAAKRRPRVEEHPEFRGLLRDVCAAPHDAGPRLVLADWLEDNARHVAPADAEYWLGRGRQMRGETVEGRYSGDGEYGHLRGELIEDTLPSDYWDDDEDRAAQGVVQNGLLVQLTAPIRWWLRHGAALVASQPVQAATVTRRRPYRSPAGHPAPFQAWVLPSEGCDWEDLPYRLPGKVFRLLRRGKRAPSTSAGRARRDYPLVPRVPDDELLPYDDLNRAVLTLCRDEAGLPRLGPGPGELAF